MAIGNVTDVGTLSAQAVKLWSTLLAREAIGKTFMKRFAGTGPDSIIQMHKDLEASRGDNIKVDLLMQMVGAGVDGDDTLKGNEQTLVYHQDNLSIDQKRNAHVFASTSQQRTLHDLRSDGMRNLSDWFAVKFDQYMLSYLAGTAGDGIRNVATELGAPGFAGNALDAPDAAHLLDKSATTMSVAFIDILVEMAKTLDPLIRPCVVDGKRYYVLVLHPYAITDLRTTTGANEWQQIQAEANVRSKDHPIFSGAMGMWNGVVIHESEYVPTTGAAGALVTNNLFLGCQAGHCAFGNAYSKLGRKTMGKGGGYFSWFEDLDDYGNETGIAAGAIFGIKKATWDSKDYGVIRLDTGSIAHS